MPPSTPTRTARGTHECPVDACPRRVPDHQLMCARHWRLVPPDLQRRLYRAWDRGAGAGTDAHADAMAAAIHAAEVAEAGS